MSKLYATTLRGLESNSANRFIICDILLLMILVEEWNFPLRIGAAVQIYRYPLFRAEENGQRIPKQ